MNGKLFLELVVGSIGMGKREDKPENIKCPYCGNKGVYLWRHADGSYMAAECSVCETVALINYVNSKKKAIEQFLSIEKHFGAYKEESK